MKIVILITLTVVLTFIRAEGSSHGESSQGESSHGKSNDKTHCYELVNGKRIKLECPTGTVCKMSADHHEPPVCVSHDNVPANVGCPEDKHINAMVVGDTCSPFIHTCGDKRVCCLTHTGFHCHDKEDPEMLRNNR